VERKKKMNENNQHRRSEDVWWFRLLDRYGLPTLFSVVLLWFVLDMMKTQLNQISLEREQMRIVLSDVSKAIKENTLAVTSLSERVARQGDDIDELRKLKSWKGN
jgi:hypothetical protein